MGAWNYLQITEGLEAFLTALFTRQLGYSMEEVKIICAKIRAEMKDPKLHAMFHVYVFAPNQGQNAYLNPIVMLHTEENRSRRHHKKSQI